MRAMSEHSEQSSPQGDRGERVARPMAWLTLGVAAVAVAVLGGGGVIVALNAPEETPSAAAPSAPEPHGPPEPAPTVVAQREAEDLRKLAKQDCNVEQWGPCIAKLDKASELDPQGNFARDVQRMRRKAKRATIQDDADAGPEGTRRGRKLDATARAEMVRVLRGDGGAPGVHVQLVCAPDAEPKRFCDELAATMKKAGWLVSRSTMPATEAEGVRGELIEVATGADDSTQAAADMLAGVLTSNGVVPRGPDDMTPTPDGASLRITVGTR